MKASQHIDTLIQGLSDWRGVTLSHIRTLILTTDPEIVEEWKWMGSPCWYRYGMICVANAHKDKVKLTFPHGASLPDPDRLFTNSLQGSAWRAIDLHKGDTVNELSFQMLIRSAISYNDAHPPAKKRT